MLEAFRWHDRVHIIDLDIMQGLQWSALFHTLATRTEGPPFVTITGLGSSMKLLVETGNQLSNNARQFGIPFDFHPITKKFGEIDIETIQLQRGEAVAIHWLQHSEIKNVLAIGGPARTRDDKFEHNWRSELARNRKFQLMPISSNTMAATELMLKHVLACLVGDDGTLRLGWKETCLFTASAWTMTTLPDGSGWSG
ncbi:protein SCARECROW 1-like [Gossypium australe]|uniref:Protein SCARECROW 1-like n=1 Tax=Gossypium australe TaxID=47621 RepID=A0A5B6VI31_9ROSI|nr:protein SCARECROW 1-like [Gossypium australe]